MVSPHLANLCVCAHRHPLGLMTFTATQSSQETFVRFWDCSNTVDLSLFLQAPALQMSGVV